MMLWVMALWDDAFYLNLDLFLGIYWPPNLLNPVSHSIMSVTWFFPLEGFQLSREAFQKNMDPKVE